MKWFKFAGFFLFLIGIEIGYQHWRPKTAQSTATASVLEKAKVERRDIEQSIHARGAINAPLITDVKSEVNGMVVHVTVTAGDFVKKGDLLVQLDKSELASQINEAELQIQSSRLRMEKMKLDLKREQQLIDARLIPQKEFDQARIDEELAQNQLEIDTARTETLRRQLAKTSILAPRTGQVLKIDVLEGMVIIGAGSVSNGTSLMTVADLSKLEVNAEVDEIDVAKLKEQMPVHLSMDSHSDLKLNGKIKFVSPMAIPKATDNSIHIFPIVVSLETTDPRLKVGLTTDFIIPVSHVEKALALPITMVFEDETSSFVYVKEKEQLIRHNIKEGISDTEYVEVLSGLNEGDQVFLNPTTAKGDKKL